MDKECSTHAKKRNAHSFSAGKPRRNWSNNIKVNVKEICWGGVDWIKLEILEQMNDWRLLNKVASALSSKVFW
jgi:hypothetical protein